MCLVKYEDYEEIFFLPPVIGLLKVRIIQAAQNVLTRTYTFAL